MSLPAPVVCEPSPRCCAGSAPFYGQGRTYLNAEFGFLLQCPPGFSCDVGAYPFPVVVPAGTIPYTPPTNPGPLRYTACDGVELVRYLPANYTEAQFNAAAQALVDDAATHLAGCKAAQYRAGNSTPAQPKPKVELAITTASPLTPVCLGQSMSILFDAEGGVEPYTFALDAGSLPDGLELNDQGNLFGTPTFADTFTFTIFCFDSAGGIATAAFTIDVVDLIAVASLTPALINIVYGPITIPSTGFLAPMAWSVVDGAMPSGMTLNPTTGQFTGAPTESGTFHFTIRLVGQTASGAQATCETPFTIVVRPCLWQITGYSDAPFTTVVGDASTNPAWSGYVNYISTPAAPPVAEVDVFRDNLDSFLNPIVSIAGKRVHYIELSGPHYGVFTPPNSPVFGPVPPPPSPFSPDFWYHFTCSVKVGGSESIVWEGYKVNGDVTAFAGTYLRGQGSDLRASIDIAAC